MSAPPPPPPTPSSSPPPPEEPLTGEAGAGGRALAAHSQRPLRRRSALSPLPSRRHKSPQRGAACKTRSGAGEGRGAAPRLPRPELPSPARGRTSGGGGRCLVPPRLPPPPPRAPPRPSPHGPRAPLAPRRGSRARGPRYGGGQRAPRGRPAQPRAPRSPPPARPEDAWLCGRRALTRLLRGNGISELRRRPQQASWPRSQGSGRQTCDPRKLCKRELESSRRACVDTHIPRLRVRGLDTCLWNDPTSSFNNLTL